MTTSKSATRAQRSPSPSTSALDRLLAAHRDIELFHDANDATYAIVLVNSHRETLPLSERGFRDYLTMQQLTATGRPPQPRLLEDAVAVLEARARLEASERLVFCRVAGHEDAVYLDLCDAERQVIRVTAEGWALCSSTDVPVYFVRRAGMRPLPAPKAGGDVECLRRFLNLPDDDAWRLIVGWLLGTLNPTGPYTVLVICGGDGSAKSTMTRVLRLVIDPNEAPLRPLPRDERDLAIAARNGWLLAFDNVSHLSPWNSDALCRLATGGGFATRQLYTDADEARFQAQRPIVMNGIEQFVTRADLASRTITLDLPRISDEHRRPEHEYWQAFETQRPYILGAFLDAAACALRTRPHLTLPSLPRMADFALWVAAGETAFGWQPGDFQAAYERKCDADIQDAIDTDPVMTAIRQLLDHTPEWEGTVKDLQRHLEQHSERWPLGLPPGFPRTPRALSDALKRCETMLARAGVTIERLGRGHRGSRLRLHQSIGAVEEATHNAA